MKILLKFASACLFLTATSLMHVDSVSFTLSDSAHVFSFSLPNPATPDVAGANAPIPFFFLNNVPLTEDGITKSESILFFVEPVGTNQLEFADSFSVNQAGNITPTNEIYVFAAGERFTSGSVAAPMFVPGTTVTGLTNDNLGTLRQGAHLSITAPVAQTPEPGSIVLLGGGLLGLPAYCAAGFFRIRREEEPEARWPSLSRRPHLLMEMGEHSEEQRTDQLIVRVLNASFEGHKCLPSNLFAGAFQKNSAPRLQPTSPKSSGIAPVMQMLFACGEGTLSNWKPPAISIPTAEL